MRENSLDQQSVLSRELTKKLELDKPVALKENEAEQIRRELGGWAKAHFEALAAYLEKKWNPQIFQEKLKHTRGRYTPETYYHVNDNVQIAPDGSVEYKDLKIVMNSPCRSDDKKQWQLKWCPGREDMSYRVQTFVSNFNLLRELIERAEEDNQQIPRVVREKFLQMKLEYEERERAFEQGLKFDGIFLQTKFEVSCSAGPASEEIKLNINLKKNSDPTDLASWRVNDDDNIVIAVEKIGENTFKLELCRSYGDSTSNESLELTGTITVNTATNQIIEGILCETSDNTDGSYKADYILKQ